MFPNNYTVLPLVTPAGLDKIAPQRLNVSFYEYVCVFFLNLHHCFSNDI